MCNRITDQENNDNLKSQNGFEVRPWRIMNVYYFSIDSRGTFFTRFEKLF